MNRLEEWRKNDVIAISMCETSIGEAANNPGRSRKAYTHIYTKSYITTPDEISKFQQIENIIFPIGAKNENQKNDVEILFNVLKYGHILITADGNSKSQPGGILGYASELGEIDIRVMNDDDAVKLVKKNSPKGSPCRRVCKKNSNRIA